MFLRTKEVKLFGLVLNWNGNPILTFNFILGDEVNIFDRGFSYFIFICTFRDCIKFISFFGDNLYERTIPIPPFFSLETVFPTKATCLTHDICLDWTHCGWIQKNHNFIWLASEGRFVCFRPILSRLAWKSASD